MSVLNILCVLICDVSDKMNAHDKIMFENQEQKKIWKLKNIFTKISM